MFIMRPPQWHRPTEHWNAHSDRLQLHEVYVYGVGPASLVSQVAYGTMEEEATPDIIVGGGKPMSGPTVEHGRELCFYDGAQYHAILVEWARRGIAYPGSSDREPEEAKSQYEGRRQVRSPW
ncbi:hypothetical protein MGG_14802 [Pyricularia oryzae 70-15]|uniref:Uncharacterized protein n=3 Tax=Pyricularia oryzae TaxID=318829 RepID=G4MTZ3_PYRO7|nr:uncharacterized protein MGG_14802 [Pyricularia oryzae 70-15]EHA54787.1 hypothetical protein MGG_14802 [Pyricularia oryzae 70-15]ELQ43244.1 hypothetical protein OOU_Y34scaffold00162g13 [Pyricularia oryzae Y34]